MVQRKEYPRDRVIKLVEWFKNNDGKCRGNESEALRRLGLTVGYLNSTNKIEGKVLRESTYLKIKRACPVVNIEWLRTGEGEMFTGPVPTLTDGNAHEGVPFFDDDFFINGADNIDDGTVRKPAYYISAQPLNNDGNAWCNFTGDSMTPRINNGDKICIRRIDVKDIIYGEIYAIVTHSGFKTVKWVVRSADENRIRLIPENKEARFGDYQEISKESIKSVYKVMGILRTF